MDRPTMGVPQAGRKYFGLGKNASYRAADRGEIPTIRIGGRRFALIEALERRLRGSGETRCSDSTDTAGQAA